MDRNTIIAIILCTIVISVGMTIQTTFFAPEADASVENAATVEYVADGTSASASSGSYIKATGRDGPSDPFHVVSETLDITFDPAGGTISSIKTTQHMDGDKPVELLLSDADDANAFMLYAGDDINQPIDAIFDYTTSVKSVKDKGDITQVTFSKDFEIASTGEKFTIIKSYAVPMSDEYMIQLAVTVKGEDGTVIPLDSDSGMYTISVGPQVGPEFESLTRNYDYRRVIYKIEKDNSKKIAKYSNGEFSYSKKPVDWMGLTGKYFAYLLIPETDSIISSVAATQETSDTGITQKNNIYMTRSASDSSSVTDIYSFYAGPQVASYLGRYDKASDNIFGLSDHNLKKALDVSWLSWLETILKVVLEAFYLVIPNYGVAIILLTVLVKLLLVPISKKGLDSTAKMSALGPKMDEIKAKYADDPQKQNEAMTRLYQEEKINPMGSCLPMFIQFPIFIALYGLLNKNFELRGAMFIPGWISDLSLPDSVATLPFSLPIIGASIHLLPIIYTVSMIFSMKITQTTTTQGQKGMMWFMTYGMPIMFFVMMYNAPSGLLVYWTITNFISIVQQVWTNKKKGKVYSAEFQAKEEAEKAKKAAKKKRR